MNSIKLKLIIIYVAVALVIMTISGTFMLYNLRNVEVERTRGQLSRHADSIYRLVVQGIEQGHWLESDAWQLLGHNEYDIHGMILNSLGMPIAPDVFFRAGLPVNDRATIAAVEGSEGFARDSVGIDLQGVAQQWMTFARPVEVEGETFIIYARIRSQFLNESLSRLVMVWVTAVAISLVLTIVFWFFVGNTLTNPILSLSRHAKAIAMGDFTQEISVRSKDEIGELANNFNHMAKELKATLSSMVTEKNKSEAILQNTSHGVLAYDVAGVLIHANTASIELLPGVDNPDMLVRQTLTLLGFEPEEIYHLSPEETRETTYENSQIVISASVTPYSSQQGRLDGFIIVLQDITRQAKLENMRKEFVANVSHELRTPLTSIRTYTETLLEGAHEDTEMALKFLGVIDDEAKRMSLLVSDLLELSRIDSKQTTLELDVVDLVALLRLAVRQGQFLADQKNQIIEMEEINSSCFIEANAARINQVVSNIISNSIKYSPENTTIFVTLEITRKYYRIFIQDQGIGIPQESIGRIFERFYRVDKARARAMGGTGLGLAIVKEIMEEHGGSVYATSKQGSGTTMILRFNRYTSFD